MSEQDKQINPLCPFCKTNLSEHKANGCLDSWAAFLSGWTHRDGARPGYMLPPHSYSLVLEPVPGYSTDISAAIALLEQLHPPLNHVRMYRDLYKGHSGWSCSVGAGDNRTTYASQTSKELPEAITKCVIHAMENQK